jgi:DNA-binding response OmpR family regulator
MKKTILIIEDDIFILETVAHRFTENDFTVLIAKNATEADEVLQKAVPDLILLDIILPGVSGLEILQKLKADQKFKSIPVVIFSNLGGEEDVKKAMELGAVDYFVKANLFPKEVVAKVTALLSK